MIENIFPKSRARMRILRHIYENPGINISELVKKSKTSPNIVLDYANSLVSGGAVRDERLGGKKKTHIRRLFPNPSSETGLAVFSLVEMGKREQFLKKYPFIIPMQEQMWELLEGTQSFCLVYGSYARMAAEKSSDFDLLVVGNIPKAAANRIREAFITLDAELSLKIETRRKFEQGISGNLHQNIIREHVILTGERDFLRSLASAVFFG